MKVLQVTALLLLFLLRCAATQAQEPVKWSIKAPTSVMRQGASFTLSISAEISTGWHIYSLTQGPGGPTPTSINIKGPIFKIAGTISAPRSRVEVDPNFSVKTEILEDKSTFKLRVITAGDAPLGSRELEIGVCYQACNDTVCMPPRTTQLSAAVEIERSVAAPKASPEISDSSNTTKEMTSIVALSQPTAAVTNDQGVNNQSGSTTSNRPTDVNQNRVTGSTPVNIGPIGTVSVWSFIWLAMTFGALSLLTPCVFPMVPITVSYFTNHAVGNRVGAARDALVYALGIILTFTALGVSLAALFGAAGINKFAASPWINLAITAIFLSFALSLLGAYSLQVPSRLVTRLDAFSRHREAGRIIGLLSMGLTFSLTSFTCTAPFVGTLLVMAAQGKWIYPIVGMLAFSTVFSLPFFVLALAPQLVSQLPKSGCWLNSVKVVMGLLEIAAAMKFLSNVDLVWHWGVFTREVVLASWLAVALLITLYLLGKFRLVHDSTIEHLGAVRLLIALVSLAFGFFLLTGLFGRRLGELEPFLPPATNNSSQAIPAIDHPTEDGNGELTWITNDYDRALQQANAEHKPLFIDFTGYTCTNCRWMEENMFPKTFVKEQLAKYLRVRLYTDRGGQPYQGFQQMQQDQFGTVALPLYVVLDDVGKPLNTFPGLTRNQADFVSFLKTGQERFDATSSMNR